MNEKPMERASPPSYSQNISSPKPTPIPSPLQSQADTVQHAASTPLSLSEVPLTMNPLARRAIPPSRTSPGLPPAQAQLLLDAVLQTNRSSHMQESTTLPSLLMQEEQLTTIDSLRKAIHGLEATHSMLGIEGEPGQRHYITHTRSLLARLFSYFTVRQADSQRSASILVQALNQRAHQALLDNDTKTLAEVSDLVDSLKTNRWFQEVCKSNRHIQQATDIAKNIAQETLSHIGEQQRLLIDTLKATLENALQDQYVGDALQAVRNLQTAKSRLAYCSQEQCKAMAAVCQESETRFIEAMVRDSSLRESFCKDPANVRLLSEEGRRLLFQKAQELPDKPSILKNLRLANMQDALEMSINPDSFYLRQCMVDAKAEGQSVPQKLLTIGSSLPTGFLTITHNVEEIAEAFELFSKQEMPPPMKERFTRSLITCIDIFKRSPLLTEKAKEKFLSVMGANIPRASLFPALPPLPPLVIPHLQRERGIETLLTEFNQFTAACFHSLDPTFLTAPRWSELKNKEFLHARNIGLLTHYIQELKGEQAQGLPSEAMLSKKQEKCEELKKKREQLQKEAERGGENETALRQEIDSLYEEERFLTKDIIQLKKNPPPTTEALIQIWSKELEQEKTSSDRIQKQSESSGEALERIEQPVKQLINSYGQICNDIWKDMDEVRKKSPREQSEHLSFWVDLASQAVDQGNLHLARAVTDGIEFAMRRQANLLPGEKFIPIPVHVLDSKHQSLLTRLKTLCDPSYEYKNLKEEVDSRRKQSKPFFPSFGIFLADKVKRYDEKVKEGGSLRLNAMHYLAQQYDIYLAYPRRFSRS